ncbi:MAG: phosphodiester glycosidase family protein [bacterium]|nr:phosphodiester glycosidase family protein [bacterium]
MQFESLPLTEVTAYSERVLLSDGAETTVHIARYPIDTYTIEVVDTTIDSQPRTLLDYSRSTGHMELINGGYFLDGLPMGEVWHAGAPIPHRAFPEQVAGERGTLYVDSLGKIIFDRRGNLPAIPDGDLLSAGPLLVHNGASLIKGKNDPEGFLKTADDHDEYIDEQRNPRAGIGQTACEIVGLVVDGRSPEDAGMLLYEFAEFARSLGMVSMLNLDGGGTSTMISRGRMRNVSRNNDTVLNPEGRRTHTGLAIVPRGNIRSYIKM